MSEILSGLESPINRVLDRLFAEPNLTCTITYRRYQGQNGMGEDAFHDFSVKTIPAQKLHRNTNTRVLVRTGYRSYIIREADLPPEVTIEDLTTNDRIIDGSGLHELIVVGIDTTLGFVVEVTAHGE